MDHRSSKRHHVNFTANLLCEGEKHLAKVQDISTGGAKLLLAGTTIEREKKVIIDLPFLNNLDAMVIWSKGQKCGLKFKDTQGQLDEFLYNLAIYGSV